MIPLFSDKGRKALDSLRESKTLYAFDFDGTLARIVAISSEARTSPKTAKLLMQLAELVPVAIISGRGVHDLRSRMLLKKADFIGNHGLEGAGADRKSLAKARGVCKKWKRELEETEWLPGIEIEDKVFSLSLHYRRAKNPRRARAEIERALGRLAPSPRLIPGKMLFNLMPEGAPHKGSAVLKLTKKRGLRNFLFVGDDWTDEDVFRLAQLPPGSLTIRVGSSRSSRAHFFIPRQSEIDRLLKSLIELHEGPGAQARSRMLDRRKSTKAKRKTPAAAKRSQ